MGSEIKTPALALIMKEIIEQLKDADKNTVISVLNKNNALTRFEKNVIYTYLFPEPLKDMELVDIYKRYHKDHKPTEEKNEMEILFLLRAYRTRQYRNYILHLLHAFIQHQDSIAVDNSNSSEGLTCGICGKELHVWDEPGDRETLGYYSHGQSNQDLCLDCIAQLCYLDELLKTIEGNNYLTQYEDKRKAFGSI